MYTSNGVHVWIDDLPEMYKNIHRIMKRGGLYMMYDIHPLMRPFDDKARVVKPYTMTGPFETPDEITFHWRVMDIMNAILGSGLTISHVAEMCARIDSDSPFWIPEKELEKGVKLTADEVNRMYDPSCNPLAALPQWLSLTAEKMM